MEMSHNEDALTHGVTVMECSKEHQEVYYQYIVQQYFKNRIGTDYFHSLTQDYIPEKDRK